MNFSSRKKNRETHTESVYTGEAHRLTPFASNTPDRPLPAHHHSALIVAAKPAVQKASTLAIKELGPPSMAQWPAIRSDLQGLVKDAQKMAFLNVTVGEAVTGLLIGVEVACWFYVGAFAV